MKQPIQAQSKVIRRFERILKASEHARFRRALDTLEPDDVVLADGYYCSDWLIALLAGQESRV